VNPYDTLGLDDRLKTVMDEARLKQLRYEADRRAWREQHPVVPAASETKRQG
jgi:hypothetical protein